MTDTPTEGPTEGRARFEIVHTGPYKFHARLLGGNGETVWTTESYRRHRDAFRAVSFILDLPGWISVRSVDEREAVSK